jgi:hypothetical protein
VLGKINIGQTPTQIENPSTDILAKIDGNLKDLNDRLTTCSTLQNQD